MSEATENVQVSSVYEIAVIPGEGIGPEVTSVALDVLAACSETGEDKRNIPSSRRATVVISITTP